MNRIETNRSRHTVLKTAVALALALGATAASAVPIPAASGIDFSGAISPVGGSNVFDSPGWDIRTLGASSPGVAGTIRMTNTSGGAFLLFDPAACSEPQFGGCGLMRDLSSSSPLPLIDFVSFTQGPPEIAVLQHASFDLQTLQVTQDPTLGFLVLSGVGSLNFAGFDSSQAEFTLTSQGRGDTSFSASIRSLGVVAVPVPEPVSLALLGAGLFGILTTRRKPVVATA
jgi:hypothetical protein